MAAAALAERQVSAKAPDEIVDHIQVCGGTLPRGIIFGQDAIVEAVPSKALGEYSELKAPLVPWPASAAQPGLYNGQTLLSHAHGEAPLRQKGLQRPQDP